MDFLQSIWSFEFALAPCLIAYIVFDAPILYRRLRRQAYVPIYFSFFPFGFSDELYATYFGENFFGPDIYSMSQRQKNFLRVKIIWLSVLSLVLTMTLSPFLAALFSNQFLSETQFSQFWWTLAALKGALLLKSLYDLRWNYKITEAVPLQYIAFVYLIYWGVILVLLDRMKGWIDEQLLQGGWNALLDSAIDFLVFEVAIGVIFVAVLGWLIPWRLTAAYEGDSLEGE